MLISKHQSVYWGLFFWKLYGPFMCCCILSVLLRWAVDQLYVNAAKGKLSPGIKQNAKGGVTLSVLKYGGWANTFDLARQIANWPTPTV